MGAKIDGPTMLLCDAEAALRTAAGETSAAWLKHVLRRSAIVTAHYYEKAIGLAHIPDATNAVDWLTKWVSKEKLEASLRYLTGAITRAAHESTPLNVAHLKVVALLASITIGE